MVGRFVVIAVALAAARDAGAQTQPEQSAARTGRRSVLPIDEEIALARSAAPASISGDARVLMLTDTGYAVVASGSSAVTCVVHRSWSKSVEPHCYDLEGAMTVMQLELRRNYLRHVGKTEAEITSELALGLLDGKYRLPTRPVLSYMMSAAQVLYDDSGRYVGKWRPHLMIYYPYLTNHALALPDRPEMRVGMVSPSGGAESSLVIVMSAFVDVVPRRAP
jgi:hypothetical protein